MDQRAEGGHGGSHGNRRKGGQRHGISNRLPKSSARGTPNFAPWNDSASSDSSSDEDSSEDDEDDENSEGDDDDEYNAYNNYEEEERVEGAEVLPQYGYAEDSINVGPASGTTSAYHTPGAPYGMYTPGQVHYMQTVYRGTTPSVPSLQSAARENPGYDFSQRHPSFLPRAVLYNNPTLIDTPTPVLATAAVQNPSAGNQGNSRPNYRPQNAAAGNSNNSRPKDRPQNPSNKKKKPYRRPKPKRFYPAELFGHKRPSGVMEAYEAAKIAGPTKKEKKAMGKAKLRSMNWPCPLCNGIFYGERHVRSHLRSKAHAKSSVWLDKKTFKIWKSTSPKQGRRKKKKKKGKKAKAKAKAAEQEKQKQKEKKPVPVVPTAVNLPEPAEGVIDNLVEDLNVLALELPAIDVGKQEAGMAEHV